MFTSRDIGMVGEHQSLRIAQYTLKVGFPSDRFACDCRTISIDCPNGQFRRSSPLENVQVDLGLDLHFHRTEGGDREGGRCDKGTARPCLDGDDAISTTEVFSRESSLQTIGKGYFRSIGGPTYRIDSLHTGNHRRYTDSPIGKIDGLGWIVDKYTLSGTIDVECEGKFVHKPIFRYLYQ